MEGSQEIYQIKVTLLDTRPPIWRRLLVPPDITLAHLHRVLQAAMGWQNSHLHEFRMGRYTFGVPDPEHRSMGGMAGINEKTVRLYQVLDKPRAKMRYLYDFGDSWEHGITLEKVLTAEPGLAVPLCTDGEFKGPPEDCGGIPGFYDFLEAILEPDHERHEELLDWIGGSFDPRWFSTDAVNQQLQKMFRSNRKAAPAAPKHKAAGR